MLAHRRLSSTRGSVLLVSLVFALVIAIALTGYLNMAFTASKISQRSFLANDAMNVTEAGLEQMLWTFNLASSETNANNAVTAWDTPHQWHYDSYNAWTTFTGFTLSQNATGVAKVYVQNFNSPGIPVPVAVCESIITPAQGVPIIKMVQVKLSRRSFFSTGMVAKNGIQFSGTNASVDSWNSNPNNASPTPNYAYNAAAVDPTVGARHAYGSIATTAISATVDVQNANIYGYVSVGSSSDTAVSVGSGGMVGDFSTPDGTKDLSRITTDFTQDLPNAVAPTVAAASLNIYKETGGGSPHYYMSGSGNAQLPASNDKSITVNGVTTYYYTVTYIDLTGNASNKFTVKDGYNVVLLVSAAEGTNAVKTAGSGGILVGTGSTLSIYTAGNVDVTGDGSGNGGIANTSGNATGFQVWGTATTAGGQTVKIAGNGDLSAIVYAPNADVSLVGNGNMFGAIVGYQAHVTGNAAFHYDESLANYGGSNPFRVAQWNELRSKAARDEWATQLNF